MQAAPSTSCLYHLFKGICPASSLLHHLWVLVGLVHFPCCCCSAGILWFRCEGADRASQASKRISTLAVLAQIS